MLCVVCVCVCVYRRALSQWPQSGSSLLPLINLWLTVITPWNTVSDNNTTSINSTAAGGGGGGGAPRLSLPPAASVGGAPASAGGGAASSGAAGGGGGGGGLTTQLSAVGSELSHLWHLTRPGSGGDSQHSYAVRIVTHTHAHMYF